MLLLLEGVDGSGKTTLCGELCRALPGATTVHHGPYKGATGRELGAALMSSLRPAFTGADTVIDRCWLSEPIYAEVYRGEPSRLTKPLVRMLERSALVCSGVIILCLPPFEKCKEAFLSGREELLDSVDQLRAVYDRYATQQKTNLPVVTYDYTTDTVEELFDRIGEALDSYPIPEITLLGDRPNVKTHAQQQYHVPFVTFSGRGCSEWLGEQLEEAGVPEAKLDWYNAYADDGSPISKDMLATSKVIALGRHAQEWCAENGVEHVHCPHPQVHKRFHSSKPYPLIDILKELHNAENKDR